VVPFRSRAATRTCPPDLWAGARRRLDQLNQAHFLDDLRVPPGNRLEALKGDRKGRHTTTSRELIRIHNGALLLDTPGLRELRVLTLDEGLGRAFPEIDDMAQQCRFRDCSHSTEPGCAVLEAVEQGEIAADRLASFRKLEAEAAYERRKADPRAMAEAVAEHKTAMKTLKHHVKHQGRK